MGKIKEYYSEIIEEIMREITPEEQKSFNKNIITSIIIGDILIIEEISIIEFAKLLECNTEHVELMLSGTYSLTDQEINKIYEMLNININGELNGNK